MIHLRVRGLTQPPPGPDMRQRLPGNQARTHGPGLKPGSRHPVSGVNIFYDINLRMIYIGDRKQNLHHPFQERPMCTLVTQYSPLLPEEFLLCLVTPVRVVVAPVTWPWLQVRPATLGLARQRTQDTGGQCSWPRV